MISFRNMTNEDNKAELKTMIIDHYSEVYGHEWIDSYLNWLEKHPQSKLRDFLISDLRAKFSSKEEGLQKDMKLLFNNRRRNSDNVAFGIFDDELNAIIGYLFLAIHIKRDYEGNIIDRYGELYELYIKPEYRDDFLRSVKREAFIDTMRSYLETFFKENDVADILSRIPREVEDLVLLGQELGFVKENTPSYDNKDLWKKTI